MILGRTFKLLQYMHINVGNKNMQTNVLFMTSFKDKVQMNES